MECWPDPGDIDYSDVTKWTEFPLKEWLQKLAKINLPQGQSEIKDSDQDTMTASGKMFEGRVVGPCVWHGRGGGGYSCEGVVFNGLLFGRVVQRFNDGRVWIEEVIASVEHGKRSTNKRTG